MICLIYKLNVSGKAYVGQTWQPLSVRLDQHCRRKGCPKLHAALRKHGLDSFRVEVLTVAHTQEVADYWEAFFVDQFDCIRSGYNLKVGGSALGRWSPELRDKVSAVMKTRAPVIREKGIAWRWQNHHRQVSLATRVKMSVGQRAAWEARR
jgi:group I intron endonuclease